MEMEEDTSALRENIEQKGANSYYFAHASTPTGPKWDGKEEPRLLSKGDASEGAPGPQRVIPVTDYSWADGKKKVSVYVEFEAMESVEEGSPSVETQDGEDTSLTFCFTVGEAVHKLVIGPLFDGVESASVVQKKDMFVIRLVKEDTEKEWSTLKKK